MNFSEIFSNPVYSIKKKKYYFPFLIPCIINPRLKTRRRPLPQASSGYYWFYSCPKLFGNLTESFEVPSSGNTVVYNFFLDVVYPLHDGTCSHSCIRALYYIYVIYIFFKTLFNGNVLENRREKFQFSIHT